MAVLNVNKAEFIRSAASPKQFIRTSLPTVVFAGKSNVGKSSVINCLLNRKQLARVGATPGKTVHVNYFLVDGRLYLVDLPGYGFARVSAEEKQRWARLMEAFFRDPDACDFGVLIVDARHRPTEGDVNMAQAFRDAGIGFLVVANKLDKLKKSEVESSLQAIREALSLEEDTVLIPFSAVKGDGRDALLLQLQRLA